MGAGGAGGLGGTELRELEDSHTGGHRHRHRHRRIIGLGAWRR